MSKKIILVIGILPSILIVMMVFKKSFNSSIVSNPKIGEKIILPQGWAFFTKSPRDVRVELFDYENHKFISLKNFSIENIFGIRRTSTRISNEIATLVKETSDSIWVKSKEGETIFNNGEFLNKKSSFLYPRLKGKYVIINKERIPWAWSIFENKYNQSTNYLKVNQVAK
ncbi:SdpA family antimicrobial peptide system protein [Tenacibaculum dicentrarchi]|uniref:SdpA family antimicrobial peptide system protein n=1 Tax=Tenacibaculum dicentrarchi TaxID=669041 RepID=UPI000C7E6F80|nr:conserved hypothetical protein [Tenacibaculum dicentrarchi]